MIAMKKERETLKFPIKIENFDQYDIIDCSVILRRLELAEANKGRGQEYKEYADRTEDQINYIMFE